MAKRKQQPKVVHNYNYELVKKSADRLFQDCIANFEMYNGEKALQKLACHHISKKDFVELMQPLTYIQYEDELNHITLQVYLDEMAFDKQANSMILKFTITRFLDFADGPTRDTETRYVNALTALDKNSSLLAVLEEVLEAMVEQLGSSYGDTIELLTE